ncbi:MULTISPECIES: hypothetical protein [unclassified Psychrobacillus]|uniref:hypothetical protein n=1 Tax=unclassified Psychrobacillus TaxID=2636677 RepID=UPI0030F87C76
MKKKRSKDEKFVIGAVAIGFLLLIVFLVVTFTNQDSIGNDTEKKSDVSVIEHSETEHDKVVVKEKEVVQEEKWETGTHQTVEVKREVASFDEAKWSVTRTELFNLVQNFQFHDGYALIEGHAESFELSEEGQKWHYALSVMSELTEGTHDHPLSAGGASNIAKGLSIPELTLAATMVVDEEAKTLAILNADSALPIFEEEEKRIEIGKVTRLEVNDDSFSDKQLILKDIRGSYGEAEVYEIPFVMDGYNHTAILKNDEYGSYQVYHIIKDESAPYETVGFWFDVLGRINQ